jgi:hypothetical protein
LEPSILVLHKPHHDNAPQQLRRAAELGFRRVNVVVTLHCQLDESRQVVSFGTFEERQYRVLDPRGLEKFRAHLALTFATAKLLEIDLVITAHLNSWGPIDDWRNFFAFDPGASYAGYSYREAMIESIVAALVEARYREPVEISLVGEMGRTIFQHPDAYRQIVTELQADQRIPQPQVGISLNFNNATGDYQPTIGQWAEFEQLIAACDFVGMSNYRWLELPVDRHDFEQAVEEFLRQFDRPGATAHRLKPLHFSEIGIGGCRENQTPASSPAEAAKTPWLGATSPKRNPWKPPAMEAFRREYFRALLAYLDRPEGDVQMRGAFLWSEGSWDPLDVVDHGFFDAEIAAKIMAHNRRVEVPGGGPPRP